MNVPMSAAKETKPRRSRFWLIVGIVVLGLAYLVFHRLHGAPQQEQAMGPIPVEVRSVKTEHVRTWTTLSARTRAVDEAEIRPEVSGRITEIRFEDGQEVKAGDILLVIDPRPYEAARAKALAALTTAQTNAEFAATELERAEGMIKTQAIARRLLDQRANDKKNAQAAILAANAQLIQAKLDVEHAYVRAPISGRASRAEITVGNLVQSGPNAPLLTSIVSNKNIYADFELDEQTYLSAIHANAEGRDAERQIPVTLTAKGDKEHVYKGFIHTFDNRIDPATGTIRARAKFDNADGALVPGMFVSVKLASSAETNAMLVPERAIGTDQDKKFVLVAAEGKAQYREVQLGQSVGPDRIVLSGLKEGDQVILDLMHVRPEAPVTAKEAAPEQPAEAKK